MRCNEKNQQLVSELFKCETKQPFGNHVELLQDYKRILEGDWKDEKFSSIIVLPKHCRLKLASQKL